MAYQLKTTASSASATKFLEAVEDPQKKSDCLVLLKLMTKLTGAKPVMWGQMVGFGEYQYKYSTGHSGTWFKVGFAPRSHGLSVYLNCEAKDLEAQLAKLGKYKMGRSCLNIKKLADVDMEVLTNLINQTWEAMSQEK